MLVLNRVIKSNPIKLLANQDQKNPHQSQNKVNRMKTNQGEDSNGQVHGNNILKSLFLICEMMT